MNCGGAGISEQVKKVFADCFSCNALADRAMVEEQAGIEIIFEIHQKLNGTFQYLMEFGCPVKAFILRVTPLSGASSEKKVVIIKIEKGLGNGHQFSESKL